MRITKVTLQTLALGAAVWVLVHTAQPNWRAIAAMRLSIGWGTLTLASFVWLTSFVLLVQLWAVSLVWWNERLDTRTALRMFVLTNLARYIPGAVWQFTGLAVAAVEQRMSPLAAAGAVLLQQLVLLSTGLLLALAFAPALLGPLAATLPLWAQLTVVAAGLVLLLWLFPVALPAFQRRLETFFRRRLPLPRAPWGSFARYLLGSALGWVGYGASFWLFGRAVLGSAAPGFQLAATAFVASYVAGIIAVFAPGGIVVREAALVAALGRHIGADQAFLLAVGARVWLITLEITCAIAILSSGGIRQPARQAGRDQGFRRTNTN